MPEPTITRETIITALRQALEPLDYVHAMWEAGAASFNRVDEWSDIDLQLDVDDERIPDVFQVVERTLLQLAPIDLKYELPQPTWHGGWQTFYHLQDTSEFLVIDLDVIQHSSPNKFIQPEVHGHPVAQFDKSHVVQWQPLDEKTLTETLKDRVETLRTTFALFQSLTLKELNRHNNIEAIAFYFNYTLRPLIEVLRIRHCPMRYNFATRYVYYDLSPELVEKLEDLYFVADSADLKNKREEAERLFYDTLEQIQFIA